MKIYISILTLFLLTILSSCTKDSLVDKIDDKKNAEHYVYIEHDMLVFDSQASFDATLQKVQNMDSAERQSWEEKLGFKSFNRLVAEVLEDQTSYEENFSYLTDEQLGILLDNGEIEKYTPSLKCFIEKGIIKINVEENEERSIDIQYPMYSSLVNIDGFVAVGNEILQYTQNKFKLIKSLDFSKVNQLKKLNENINDAIYFVTDIITQTKDKVTLEKPIFTYSAESYTTDRQKVVATEKFQYYNRYYDGINFEANYVVRVENFKKYWGFLSWNWNHERIRTWIWGDFDIESKGTLEGKESFSFNYADRQVYDEPFTLLKKNFSQFDYVNASNGGPSMLRSTINVVRWGGPNGLGVRLIDHVRYERF